MTKPVTRKMAVDCLLSRFFHESMTLFAGNERLGHAWLICGICQFPIKAGQRLDFDHIHADIFDGPHEYENLRPLHFECHKDKTARDIKANAKVKRLANPMPSKHPMKSSGRKLQSRPFAKRGK